MLELGELLEKLNLFSIVGSKRRTSPLFQVLDCGAITETLQIKLTMHKSVDGWIGFEGQRCQELVPTRKGGSDDIIYVNMTFIFPAQFLWYFLNKSQNNGGKKLFTLHNLL